MQNLDSSFAYLSMQQCSVELHIKYKVFTFQKFVNIYLYKYISFTVDTLKDCKFEFKFKFSITSYVRLNV